jgi:methylamine dehydrogenase accessory protein MauD
LAGFFLRVSPCYVEKDTMDTAVLLIRILLAAVFALAGVGKLLDRDGSRRSLRDFGMSDALANPVSVLLPLAELAVAAGLVFRPTAQWALVGALLLLLAFMAGIANALRHGVQPDCNCFGQIHSAPAGRETLIRNGILAALAVFALAAGPGPAVDTWVRDRSAAELVAVAAAAAAIGLGFWALRLRADRQRLSQELNNERKRAALAPPGLPVGSEAPDFALLSIDRGEVVSLDSLRAGGRPVLLMFTSPNCGPCSQIFPILRRWQQSLSERVTIALVSVGTEEANEYLSEEHGLEHLLVQEGIEVSEAYHIRGTPSAVLVTGDGRIGTTTAERIHEVEPLVRHALRGGDLASVSNGSAV